MATDRRAEAVRRLDLALAEQTLRGERYRAALGTSLEETAYARLQEAGDQVTAQQVWLDHFDERRGTGVGADEPRA